jgi:hypothetical protein
MVDEGYALLDDDAGNEFNASAWWGQSSLPLSGEKSDQLNAMLEKSPSAKLPEESNEVSILKKSSTSGAYVIGYHNR